MKPQINPGDGDRFTISLDDAQQRITNWQGDQTLIKNALSQNLPLRNSPVLNINAFTFDLADITDLIVRIGLYNASTPPPAEPINGIRFYLGKVVTPTIPEPPYSCLVAVGVSGFEPNENVGGDDIITLPSAHSKPPTLEESIFDFSYPCPTTCADPGKGIMDL